MTLSQPPSYGRSSHTKIVATIGPACANEDCLVRLIRAGVDVFRINMAHGDRVEHEQRLHDIRAASRRVGRPVAVLVDLAGPKIRLGELPGGEMECELDRHVSFVRGAQTPEPGQLTTTYEPLVDELRPGDRVMLADGTVSLIVEECTDRYARCRVTQAGLIRSRQGVNLPGAKLSVPALGDADRDNAVWAAANDVDYVGLSFVRTAEEVRLLKSLLKTHGCEARVVAKIEKPEALEHLAEIVAAADAVMAARGDLGVETDIARVPLVQSEIIAACHAARKPVIIATQMLDSMQRSRIPTRAEVTDVANAVLDGADACMLSGETAIGRYPIETVEMMHRIALATEPILRGRPKADQPETLPEGVDPVTEAIVFSAGRIAEQLGAKMIVVASASGATALCLSKDRNFVPTVGVSNSNATLRRMCLYWGVRPLPGAPTDRSADLPENVTDWGRDADLLESGDRVVLVAGTGLATHSQNMIVVHELE